jgi:hypothetical protein
LEYNADAAEFATYFGWGHLMAWGLLLLGIWLIASGALVLVPALAFQGAGTVLAILAVAAGVLVILDR